MSVIGIINILEKSVFKNARFGEEVTKKKVLSDTNYKKETVKLLLKKMRREKILKSQRIGGISVYKPTRKARDIMFLVNTLRKLGVYNIEDVMRFSDAKLKVADCLRGKKLTLKEISDETGLTPASVRCHLESLVQGNFVRRDKNKYFLLPDGARKIDCIKRLRRKLLG